MLTETIFSFWEPRGTMPAYVALCRKSWDKNLPNFEIIDLDHSNLSGFISAGSLDITRLKKLPYYMQKDAIMVAVLKHNGGIFMDTDTLIMSSLQFVFNLLEQTDIVLFNTHLGFMAANPGSIILGDWLERIHSDLNKLNARSYTTDDLGWDYMGNRVLADIMNQMARDYAASGLSRISVLNPLIALMDSLKNVNSLAKVWSSINLNRIRAALWNKKINFLFNTEFINHLRMLDRKRYGFISEAVYYGSKYDDPQDKYVQFWFSGEHDTEMIF